MLRLWRRGLPLAVLSCTAIVVGACGAAEAEPPSSPSPRAEVSETGADCLSDEVVANLTGGVPAETGRDAPPAGTVPPDFEAVEVVHCTIARAVTLQEPAPPRLVPPVDDVDPENAVITAPEDDSPDHLQRLTVESTTLTGDLKPLLAALARPSDPVPRDNVCMAMMELKPQIFLVDAAGSAVRPQWPVDACGFTHEGAVETLAGLREVDSATAAVDHCFGPCTTTEDR